VQTKEATNWRLTKILWSWLSAWMKSAKLPNWGGWTFLPLCNGRLHFSTAGRMLSDFHLGIPWPLRTFRPKYVSEKKESSELHVLAAAGAVVIGAGYFGSILLVLWPKSLAFAFVGTASFFPWSSCGIFSSRINKEGAISANVSGLVFTLSYIIFFKIHQSRNWILKNIGGLELLQKERLDWEMFL